MKRNLFFNQATAIGKRLVMVLTMLLIVGIGQVWGAETTVSWTATSGALGSGIGNGTIKTGSFTWNYNRTKISGESSTGYNDSSQGAIRLGKNGGVENITFTTSDIPGMIKSIIVECASYQGKHNLSINVGGNAYYSNAVPAWGSGQIGTVSSSGNSSGIITISFTNGSRALYIKSISVTYEENSGSGTTPGSGENGTVTMTAGTNGSTCTVNGIEGIKVGTSSKGGDMSITIPAGATMLHIYAAAWNNVNGLSLNITPTDKVTITSIALKANSGIANNSPFTLSGNEHDYQFDIPLQNITTETTLKFTSSYAKRFVVWGATYETSTGTTETTVTLQPNGGTGTAQVLETTDGSLTLPECEFTYEGYRFVGWNTKANGTGTTYQPSAEYTPAENPATLYAKWAKEYTVTYNANGGTTTCEDNKKYIAGEQVTVCTSAPTRDSYTFNGWSYSPSVAITDGQFSMPANDVTITAQWTSNKTATSLTWSADSYSATIDVDNDFPELTKSPADLSPIAYSSSNTSVATIDANGNITLVAAGTTIITATFDETETHASATDSYTLTVNPSNCRWIETDIEDIEYGDEVVVAMETATGTYALNSKNGTTGAPEASIIYPEGNKISTYEVARYNSYIIWNIEKDGDNLIFHPFTEPNKNLYCNTAENDNNRVRVGSSNNAIINHKFIISGNHLQNNITNHYLGIYYSNGNAQDWRGYLNSTQFSGQTLKFYKRECLDSEHYWVTWDAGEGAWEDKSSKKIESYQAGATITAPTENPTREGYRFDGWDSTPGNMPAENTTFTAKWTQMHTITWMADGDQFGESVTYLDGETLALPKTAPEACQGSVFVGWTDDEKYSHDTDAPTYVTAGSAVTTDAIYYAVYAEAPEGEEDATYTLVTTANDFTDGIYVIAAKSNDYFYFINGQYVYDGLGVETTGLASNLVNDNSFAASFLPGGAVELDIEDDGDPLGDNYYFISYYDEVNSKWLYLDDNGTKQTILWTDADEVYTYLPIFDNGKYYLQSGSGAKISQNGSNKASFIRNYASTGSFYNSLYFFKKSAGSIIYTKYSTTCTPTYYITYDLNGGEGGCENGSVPADENYTICANIPTKTGYDFVGWSTADDNEAEFLKADVEAGQAIIENVSNNVELYAVWEAETYEITWWSNGVEYTTTSHTFDTELQLPADPYTCYGAKTFIGWTEADEVSEDGVGIVYIDENTNPSENKTYYAVFADEELGEPEKHDATLSFASKDQRTEFSSTQQVWEQNGITLTNDKASAQSDVADYANPARFYAASSISITAPGNITKIVFTCSADKYATALATSIGETSSGTKVTATLDGESNTFSIASLSAQVQMSSLTVTYLSTPETTYSNYTTTPTGCAEMDVAENAYVTSANAQSVKVNVPVTVNFQDGYTIEATLNDGTKFEVVSVSEITDNKATVTLAYTPDYSDDTENTSVQLTAKYGENFVIAKSFTLNGRSLPETFAVVAKVGNMWYALPEVGYEAGKHATAYPVEVDNIADPTAVTSAVANNAAWSLRQVYEAQKSNAQNDRYETSGTNFVLENKQTPAKLLNASAQGDKGSNNYLLTSAQYDNYYYSTNPGLYEWTLATKDLETYTLTNVQRIDKQINISTYAAFGLHTADVVTSDLRFLPIQGTYTTLATQVVEWKEKSVVVMYNGDPAQTASVSVNAGEAQTTTLSSAQKDIAVYELTADGLATNPTQQLSITIGSEKVILPIPYIVSGEKTDLALLPGATVAARQEVAKVADLVVLKDATLTADGAKTNSYKFRNVTVYGGGKLVVPADKGFGVNTLTLRIGGVTEEGNYDYVYPEFELNTTYDGAYSNTSGKINLDYVTTKSQYYTFVAPFEVETKDIKYPVDIYGSNVEAANRGSFEFQYYDGKARAAGEKGWKVVAEDPTDGATLTAHKGYTFYGMPKKVSVNGGTSTRQKFGIHRIPMAVAAGTVMSHENTAQTTAVSAYPSQHNINAGWNLIGNPYMSTISGLDNTSIQIGTIVLVDDRWQWSDQADQYNHRFIVFPSNDGEWYYTSQAINAKLPAFKNFFVQIAGEEINAISIPFTHRAPSGISARRATYETDKDIEMAIVLEKDEAHSDQMDFLINDAYGAGFDYNADFTKMMNNTQLNLYGVLMEDNLSFVALDHYSARGSVAIGYQVPAAGEYTLRISDKPYVMLDKIEALYVTDHEMNPAVTTNLMEEDYVFHVGKAEINDTRFTISLTVETNTNGGDITTNMGEIDIHSQQPQKFLYDGRLYILRDGKVYSATGHEIKTINE